MLLLFVLYTERANSSHVSDDDLWDILFGKPKVPTKSPSTFVTNNSPTVSPQKNPPLVPTKSPTRVITSNSPTVSPQKSPTKAPTSIGRSNGDNTGFPSLSPTVNQDITTLMPTIHQKITNNPSADINRERLTLSPTKDVSATKQPTTRQGFPSPSPSPSKAECVMNNGSFGMITSEKRIVPYYYKVEYEGGADITEIMTDLEKSIASVILRETKIFSECNDWNPVEEKSIDESKIVGMSSFPADRILSFCDKACAIVEGRLTVYTSSSSSQGGRKLSDVNNDIEEVLSAVRNGMNHGDLISANSNILTLTYIEPEDGSLLIDDTESNNEEGEKSDTPVQRGIPAYGYALIATSATLVVLASAVAIRSRTPKYDSDSDSEHGDDEDPISLQDDGSTDCLDTTTNTTERIFRVWRNMHMSNRTKLNSSLASKGSPR